MTTTHRWWGLLGIALGVSMIIVDTTIVNVITPSVIADLGISSSQAQWIQESYAIVFAALLLLFGRLADLVGARRLFATGVVVFALTSLLAGLAPSGTVLILARFLQGVGGAMILPTSLSLLNQTFTGQARGQAFAVWGSTIGAATAVGPVIGGWFAEHADWRWVFGINIPAAVLVLTLVLRCVARSPHSSGRIDVPGALLSVTGLAALAFALVEGRTYGWIRTVRTFTLGSLDWNGGPSPVLVALLASAGLLTALVIRQVRLNRDGTGTMALMNTRLFAIASFRNGNLATVIIGLGEFGIIAVLPLWLQFSLGYSSLGAGAALLPLAGGSLVASGLSFGVISGLGPLDLVRIGLGLEAAALAGLGVVAAATSAPWWAISIALFVYGVGVGFATAQVTNVVQAEVPTGNAGQGSALQSTFRQLGSALGIAVLTTVFYTALSHRMASGLADSGLSTDRIDGFTAAVTDSAGAAISGFAANDTTVLVARAAQDAMAEGIALSAFLAAGLLALGLVATLLIPRPTALEPDTPGPDTPGSDTQVPTGAGAEN